jgi:hypothetical protein
MKEPRVVTKSERKKARRKTKRSSERAGGRELEALIDAIVEEALRLAPEVASAANRDVSERGIDIVIATPDAARFMVKRINEALVIGEWLDDVEVWLWQAESHTREPLTDAGRTSGLEIRLEQPSRLTSSPSPLDGGDLPEV